MIATLNNLFGAGWVIAIVILAIFVIDLLSGRYWFFRAMDLIDLDHYSTLWDKYSDPDRNEFRQERHEAYDNYSQYLREMLVARDWCTAKKFRRAKGTWDYITLYYMERAWDGDIEAKNWLEKDWEE